MVQAQAIVTRVLSHSSHACRTCGADNEHNSLTTEYSAPWMPANEWQGGREPGQADYGRPSRPDRARFDDGASALPGAWSGGAEGERASEEYGSRASDVAPIRKKTVCERNEWTMSQEVVFQAVISCRSQLGAGALNPPSHCHEKGLGRI
jgi:hypothetical protein